MYPPDDRSENISYEFLVECVLSYAVKDHKVDKTSYNSFKEKCEASINDKLIFNDKDQVLKANMDKSVKKLEFMIRSSINPPTKDFDETFLCWKYLFEDGDLQHPIRVCSVILLAKVMNNLCWYINHFDQICTISNTRNQLVQLVRAIWSSLFVEYISSNDVANLESIISLASQMLQAYELAECAKLTTVIHQGLNSTLPECCKVSLLTITDMLSTGRWPFTKTKILLKHVALEHRLVEFRKKALRALCMCPCPPEDAEMALRFFEYAAVLRPALVFDTFAYSLRFWSPAFLLSYFYLNIAMTGAAHPLSATELNYAVDSMDDSEKYWGDYKKLFRWYAAAYEANYKKSLRLGQPHAYSYEAS